MSKYDPPSGPPPPTYGSSADQSRINSPAPAHFQQQNQGQADYYSASPYQQPGQPVYQGNGYPPHNQHQYENAHAGGYYAPGPQMGYAQQQPPPGPYGQQGPGYYGPQGGYGQGGYGGGYGQGYGPQGQYRDDRRGGGGFMEAMLASLACCCCLDACLLF